MMQNYTDILEHPQFAFCQPTADTDVAWFHLNSKEEIWHEIHIDYFSVKVSIHYFIRKNTISLHIEMPPETPSPEQTPQEKEEIAWQRLSIWIDTLQNAENYISKPKESLKYSLWERFDKAFLFDYQEGMLLGFYTNFWDED
ncbi:MAG: hypothetical protein MUC49_00930 [Raineya sp.]|jgi:hypothetical protein|nr:hypothetical protein [Raineya sp.]